MTGSKVRLTGLWLKKQGLLDEFMIGDISPTANLIIQKNLTKQNANEPDFIAYITSPKKAQSKPEPEQEPEGFTQLQWWHEV